MNNRAYGDSTDLILRVLVGQLDGPATRGQLIRLRPSDLPTVMRKAWDLARDLVDR